MLCYHAGAAIDAGPPSCYYADGFNGGFLFSMKGKNGMSGKLTVAVIFGGASCEHQVSVASAKSLINAIDKSKYHVVPLMIDAEGRWFRQQGLPCQEADFKKNPHARAVALWRCYEGKGIIDLEGDRGASRRNFEAIDVAFPIIHGTQGEDGSLQGLLEMVDIPYVGSGVTSSALGMDKEFMKIVFSQNRFPIVDYFVFGVPQWKTDAKGIIEGIERRIGYPAFIKPACLGSSVGVSKVRSLEELTEAVGEASLYNHKLIAERAVIGRELECAVLGNDAPSASVVGEVKPKGEFYDYQSKYTDGMMEFLIPAELPPRCSEEVRTIALKAFKALDCSGMARADFFLENGSGKIYLNEINTIPGFTEHSAYPKLWAASGVPYPELIDKLIRLAIDKYAQKKLYITKYGV